jgi:hypothetical protein
MWQTILMPKRKDDAPVAVTVKARVTTDIMKECDKVRLNGAHKRESQSSFLGYLIELGLAKYIRVIQPAEQGNDELAASGASAEVSAETIKAKGFKSSVKT